MNNLVARIGTGLILGSIFMASVVLSAWGLIITFSIILMLSAIEYSMMMKSKLQKPALWVGLVGLGQLIIVLLYIFQNNILFPLTILPLFLIMLSHLFSKEKEVLMSLGMSVLGYVYLIIPIAFVLFLTNFENYNSILVWSLLLMVWANDTFAYAFGSWLGKHKLWPKWSPKKSWEGFVGGLICTIITSLFIFYFSESFTLILWIILPIVVSTIGTLGDFFESMIKRNLEIKDSGDWLPGHGGFLDRFDNLLFVAPFYFCTYIIYLYLA